MHSAKIENNNNIYKKPDKKIEIKIWDIKYKCQHSILYKYYIPWEGDSRKYHPEECDYQPRRSRGW